MMAENNRNTRRSSRIKPLVNCNENVSEPSTPTKTPRATRGRPRKNSNSNDVQSTTPSTRTRGRPKKQKDNSNEFLQELMINGSIGELETVEDESTIYMNDLEDELANIQEEVKKPTELFTDDDVSGHCIYGFQTPAKKNSMVEKAKLSRTPTVVKTPNTTQDKELRVVVQKVNLSTDSPSTSRSKKSERIPKTPTTRKRQVRFSSESESVSEDSEFVPSNSEEESEDEYEDSDVENEENKTPEKPVQKQKVQIPITPVRRGRSKNNIEYRDYHMKTDEYFVNQAEKALTSDNTLGRLKTPLLDEGKLQELLRNEIHISDAHKMGICDLMTKHKSLYPMWHFIMEEGFSVLLHGVGSKRTLINDFHKEIVHHHPTLIVNGFFPSLTIKDILTEIITELMELDCPTNPQECLNLIEDTMKINPDDRLYLLIHNIDGQTLRSNKTQDILSRLASIPNVRMMASVDHINAPLIWDNVKRSRFNFYWCDATTLLPYEAETSYESSLLVQRSGTLALSSLHNVFASLNTNAKAIYTILVKYQLQNGKNNLYSGMAFKDLYRSAREGFFVNSDVGLRAQLTEFNDHKLVKSKRNVDGAEYLIIPLENSILQKFIDEQDAA